MSYMLLIMEPRGQRAERSAVQGREVYERMLGFAATLKQRGVLVSANALKSEALRLSVEDGRAQILDGPFTESKELIGGYSSRLRRAMRRFAITSDCPAAAGRASVREIGTCYSEGSRSFAAAPAGHICTAHAAPSRGLHFLHGKRSGTACIERRLPAARGWRRCCPPGPRAVLALGAAPPCLRDPATRASPGGLGAARKHPAASGASERRGPCA